MAVCSDVTSGDSSALLACDITLILGRVGLRFVSSSPIEMLPRHVSIDSRHVFIAPCHVSIASRHVSVASRYVRLPAVNIVSSWLLGEL